MAGKEFSPDGRNEDEMQKKETEGVQPDRKEESAGKRQAGVVKKLLEKVEKKLSGDEVKATLGDYIRLVQLQKELEEEQPREIKVTWVEPTETAEPKTGSKREE